MAPNPVNEGPRRKAILCQYTMFISFEFLGVPKMRVKKKPQVIKSTNDCPICFKNFRVEDLQSFHLEHSLHLACIDCIKHYLDSLASAIVTCPYCRLPVESIL